MGALASTLVSLLTALSLVIAPGPGDAPPSEPAPVVTDTSTQQPTQPAPAQPAPAQPAPAQPAPAPQPTYAPQPAPAQPAPAPQPTYAPQPTPAPPQPDPWLMARGIKETVMGSVFLTLGGALLAFGIPTIVSGAEDPDDKRKSLKIAGGATATGIGGLFGLFGIVLLPIGISNLVRARAGLAFNRSPRGTWTTGVRVRF